MKELVVFIKFFGPLAVLAIAMKIGVMAYNDRINQQYTECMKLQPHWACRTF